MHAPIVTLTINPALDVTVSVSSVVPERKLRCGPGRFDPGGGGFNVSRAIRNLGGSSTAILALGGQTGEVYRGLARAEGIRGHVITIEGETRESFTASETSTGRQYRFVLPGPELSEHEWQRCLTVAGDAVADGGFIVASGSLPPGVPIDFYARLSRHVTKKDVRVIIDSAGPSLEAALAEGVYLIKPSREELADLVGIHGVLTPDEQVTAVSLVTGAEHVALSLGPDGALLSGPDGILRLSTPPVDTVSAVGAGDSFLGGLVLRLAEGRPLAQAFRTAVAAGSAAAMRPATELCRAEDVTMLESRIVVIEPGGT